MQLSLRLEQSYTSSNEVWPYRGLYTPRSTGWSGIHIFREVLLTYEEDAKAITNAISFFLDGPCEDNCFCGTNCDEFDSTDFKCKDQCWVTRTHDPDSFNNAADFLLAHLVPGLAIPICNHKGGEGGEVSKRSAALEGSTDENGVEFLGCLLIGAFEALKIANFFEIPLTWLGLRALAWGSLKETGQEILIYPEGTPKNAMLMIAMVSSDDVISIV